MNLNRDYMYIALIFIVCFFRNLKHFAPIIHSHHVHILQSVTWAAAFWNPPPPSSPLAQSGSFKYTFFPGKVGERGSRDAFTLPGSRGLCVLPSVLTSTFHLRFSFFFPICSKTHSARPSRTVSPPSSPLTPQRLPLESLLAVFFLFFLFALCFHLAALAVFQETLRQRLLFFRFFFPLP